MGKFTTTTTRMSENRNRQADRRMDGLSISHEEIEWGEGEQSKQQHYYATKDPCGPISPPNILSP